MKDFKKLNQEEKVLFRVVKSLFHDLWTHEINPEEAMEEIAKFILPIERLEQLTKTAHYSKPYVPSPNRSATLQEQLDNYLKEQKDYEELRKQEADKIAIEKKENIERIELKRIRLEQEAIEREKELKIKKRIEKREQARQRIAKRQKEKENIAKIEKAKSFISSIHRGAFFGVKPEKSQEVFEPPFKNQNESKESNLLRYILYTNLKEHSPFSKRITNVLISHKIMDVSDLLTFKEQELIKLRFVSASVIYQIKSYLKEISKDLIIPLTLGMDVKVLVSQLEIVNKSLDEK